MKELCRAVMAALLVWSLAALWAASAAGSNLHIEFDGADLTLRYSAPQPFGSVRLVGAEKLEDLRRDGTPLAVQLVTAGQAGQLKLTNWTSSVQQFFTAIWTQELENPAPESLSWIDAGQFVMGSPEGDPDREIDEGPSARVQINRGLLVGRYEVTQAEYAAIMSNNPSFHTGDPKLPVENVTWEEAREYCRKLTESERAAGRLSELYAYRLPTESEWEYAARNGSTTRFFFGDDPSYETIRDYAWLEENSAATSHAVGQKKPSPSGLFDIYGNVAEWCLDLD